MAIKASENFKVYKNPNGPTITSVSRPVLEAEGLYFKDIDGSGKTDIDTGIGFFDHMLNAFAVAASVPGSAIAI